MQGVGKPVRGRLSIARYNRPPSERAVLNCNTLHYTVFREESKQDSDMDEPWIMTVKGPHGVKGSVVPMLPLDEQPASLTLTHTNHRSTNHSQPNKPHANGASRSPPKDSTLNHYRSESRDSLRDGQVKHAPVRYRSNISNSRLCDIYIFHVLIFISFSYFLSSLIVPTARSRTSATGGHERETR